MGQGLVSPGGGGGSHMKGAGMFVRNFEGDKSGRGLKETFTAKYNGVLLGTP